MLGGYEPCTIKDAKSYKPSSNSISEGQVLHCPYNYEKTSLIVKETARLTTNKIEIDEGLREILNNKLNYLNDHLDEKEEVSITYFIKDSKNSGGKYITKTGIVKRIDTINKFIKFTDNDIIYITDVISITSELFENIYE